MAPDSSRGLPDPRRPQPAGWWGAVGERFLEQARRGPDRVALVEASGGGAGEAPDGRPLGWTYAALAAASGRLAARLRRAGIGREDVVALHTGRSADLVRGMLGTLEAGAAFLILDPAHPGGHRARCLELARAAGWIGSAAAGPVPLEVRAALERLAPRARIELGAAPEAAGAPPGEGAGGRAGAGPDDLAYVAFTSGTTGAPLGIAGTHRPLSHFFAWSSRRFGFTADDRFALLSGLGHDPLLRDVFTPLLAGGALYLPALRGPADYQRLPAWLGRNGITVLHLTPALGRALAAAGGARLPALRWAFFGGDALDPRLVRDFRALAPNARLVAFYGTTETPQAPAWHPIDSGEPAAAGEAVPLGRGIDGAQLLVLRDPETLAAPGEPGEIAVRTPYLARGYLGGSAAPGAPAGRFRASPWSGEAGDRLFLTGDRGRFRADGSVVFLGRIGRQVKVRGFRVEPEGIERALLAHPEVAAAAVVPRRPAAPGPGDDPGETALAAFVAPRRPGGAEPEALRRHLASRLPAPMVPAAFHRLERLPLRPNGKVDLAALEALAAAEEPGRRLPEEAEPPRPGTEARLAGLWAEVLGRAAVGRGEHFFAAGGHSLAAIRLISRVREAFGLELALDRLLDAPTLAGMARSLDAARSGAPGRAGPDRPDGEAPPPLPPVVPGLRAEPAEPSLAQARLWFLDRLRPGSAAYTLCDGFRLDGALDAGRLARSLRAVAARHESLRSAFPDAGGAPALAIDPAPRLELPVVDLRGLPPDAAERAADRLARRVAGRPFDLARGPLLRSALARLAGDRHWLLVAVHHAVTDGWSQDLLYRELGEAYRALAAGEPPAPPAAVQYPDFAAWQRRFLDRAALEPLLAYWRERLAEAPAVELAADRPRRAARTAGGRAHRWRVDPATAGGLRRLALAAGATPFIALLAAFELLLARHTGSDDVAVGFPLANRRRPELEGLIGFFVNTVVLRDRLGLAGGREPSFRELLGRTRDGVMAAHAHQDLPFERLVEALMPERDLARNPLFQVAFAVRYGPEPRPELPGVAAVRVPLDPPEVRLDLEVHACVAIPSADGRQEDWIDGQALYDPGLFDATTVERLFRGFRSLLAAAVAAPDAPAGELALLASAERHQLLVEWGRPAPLDPSPPALARRFADRVAEAPDSVAAVDGDGARQLSYAELGREAGALAERLRGAGVEPGDLVALYLGRSLDLVVATLGVQTAGGAPLPVDPANPPERVAQVLDQAFPAGTRPVVLTWEPLLPRLPERYRGAEAIVLLDPGGGEMERRRRARAAPSLPAPDPELLGFAVATSGSTGRPKIAELPQRGLSALVDWHRRECGAGPGVHTSLLAAPGFDASVWELWTALGNGATLELPPPYAALDQDAVARWLAERRVEVGFLPTPLAEGFLARVVEAGSEAPALRVLVAGADVLRARPAPGASFRLVNGYGPAEATVVATWGPVAAAGPAEQGLPGIGRPLPGVALALLDPRLRPVPPGAPGEICLGGPGLARGYRGRPAATAAAFVPDSWAPSPGERLYRTGDLGALRPDGTLAFLGRRDQQAKIRGYRIEPGEIEAALKSHPEVAEAAVLVHSAAGGDKRLVAFVAGGVGAGGDAGSDRERVDHWRRLYDRTYAEPGAPGGGDPDFRGWNSSYTGEPLPAAEMREWRQATVERILALRPRRVLEIGCGTGLVLDRVAPRCERYLGTDLSRPALDLLERRLAAAAGPSGTVRLLEREARDFTGVPEGAFDLVVLNSVVQYFPGVPYLLSVLGGAAAAAAPEGAIFVGDVRSLPLLEAFWVSVELAGAAPGEPPEELRARARQRALDEEELVIDPGFFLALERELPRLAAVRIEPKRGRRVNELTRFRYDVTLLLDRPRAGADARPLEPRWLEWGRDAGSAAAVAGALAAEGPAALLAAGVPNARLAPRGLEPEDLLELGRRAGYRASLSWARPAADGAFDVLFVRGDAAPAAGPDRPVADGRSAPLAPLERLASDPLAAERRRLGARRLRAFLEERLPRYMVPAEIVLLPELPLNANGKLDRRALAARLAEPPALGRGLPPPRTPEERRIAAIWSEALGIESVGLRDDFFVIGGHSLVAVAVAERIQRELAVELPLAAFFRNPTVEGLARAIQGRAAS
jgi:amino acid adenylation domain-containing protein